MKKVTLAVLVAATLVTGLFESPAQVTWDIDRPGISHMAANPLTPGLVNQASADSALTNNEAPGPYQAGNLDPPPTTPTPGPPHTPFPDHGSQESETTTGEILPASIPTISGGAATADIKISILPETQTERPSPTSQDDIGPLAPDLLDDIEGINFDQDAVNNSNFFSIPPDPIGAAGPDHLVSVVNTSIEWFSKGGALQNSQSLAGFFNTLSPQTDTFDPKVIYDQHANRFLVVTLDKVDNGANDLGNVSTILLAVSDDSNPNGAWRFLAIDAKTIINGDDHWADYPGFAVDNEAVYITTNMFSFGPRIFGGSRLWIVAKGLGSGGFYDGGTASFTVHNPPAEVGVSAGGMQPAHMFGTGPAGVGTFLVRYDGLTLTGNEFLSITQVNAPLTTPTFSHQFLNVGDIDNTAVSIPDAPQSGSATNIETNDRRTLNAVWRNNNLWGVTQVVPPSGADAGQATAHWFKLDTTNLSLLSVADQGNVGGEDIAAGTHTFFPSISVDAVGNMAVGFSASASTIFPGAFYTARLASDATGTVQDSETLRAGQDSYVRTVGGGTNRWGDYSGAAIDPSDESTFWVFNEYALPRGSSTSGGDGRWGTAFGSFSFCAPPSSGNWSIGDGQVCTLTQDSTINGDLTLEQNSSLTISSGQTLTLAGNATLEQNAALILESSAVLDLDFATKHLLVRDGAKVLIQINGKIE